MKVIAIGGQPAVGKSTLMKSFIESCGEWEDDKPIDLLYGHRTKSPMYDKSKKSIQEQLEEGAKELKYNELFIAGRYLNLTEEEEKFPGTDRLSMAVMPEFKKYVEQNKDKNEVVIFEGDRLVSHNLLTWLSDTIGEENLFIIMLDVPQSVVNQRHIDRNDTQTEQFIKSRQTKYETIESDFFLSDRIKKMKHVDEDDTLAVVSYMHNVIDGDI